MTAAVAEKNPLTSNASTNSTQIRVTRRSLAYWRVTFDNPPINVMGPEMVREFQDVINSLEADKDVRVVVFDSAVDGYFLNHSDFLAKLEDLTSMPNGPTGLPPWPDFLARLTRLPVVSIALIRGRATGNGSEITLACDMSFASREKAIISQWEVGVGMVAGGGPMARLPRLIGRNRALEVLLSSEDLRADQAEAYGYVNRALPDAEIDAFVEELATRIAQFDKWAIATTKRLVNTSLPPDVELGAGWDACIASLGRPAAQDGIKALMERGFHKPGDVEDRLGYYLGRIPR
jgi:enoyl-CoA hydratase/carnithine racemase